MLKSWLRHPLRGAGRLIWLGAELVLAAVRDGIRSLLKRSEPIVDGRAQWLQVSCRRMLRVLNVHISQTGNAPPNGLLVCNHLSYLDILVLAAITPCLFVAKQEVRGWPLFGWFARRAGTVFVDRDKRVRSAAAAGEIEKVLGEGGLVVLFPEGTSTGGDRILPFKSSLFEPAIRGGFPVIPCCLQYDLPDGDAMEEVCYWKDMTLIPHMLNLVTKKSVHVAVRFGEPVPAFTDRKELARKVYSEVTHLREAQKLQSQMGRTSDPATAQSLESQVLAN